MDKEKILGFDICKCSEEELIKNIFTDFQSNEQLFIVNINPEIAVANYKNSKLKEIFNSQKYQIPDGAGIVWASKKKKGNIKSRITGIDLMIKICKESIKYNASIYLYGGKPGIAELAKEELIRTYPKINIIGVCDGYCSEEKAISDIKKNKPDILFVGLGSPKQEQFIIEYKQEFIDTKILMPVGGSFDVISKTKKRAPNWVIKCNIEWLYRLFKEPTRIKRQLKLINFMFLIVKENHRKTK